MEDAAGAADALRHRTRTRRSRSRWSPRITAICHSRVRRADVADDLAQETFLRQGSGLSADAGATREVGGLADGHRRPGRPRLAEGEERRTTSRSAPWATTSRWTAAATTPEDAVFLADEEARLLAEVGARGTLRGRW